VTKVLVVMKFAPPGSAQDQQRGTMYEPLFRAAGIDVQYVSRYPMWAMDRSKSLIRSAQPVSAGVRSAASARVRRTFDALSDRRIVRLAAAADVVYLVKTDSPQLVRAIRRATPARIVFDLADIRLHDPVDLAATQDIAQHVDAITVDNEAARAYAARFGKPVHLFPSAGYVERFDEQRSSSRRGTDGRVVLGWMGTPSTTSNLYLIFESLEDVFKNHQQLELRLLGMPMTHELLGRFEHVRATVVPRYDATAMVREVLRMDIGLFPQYDLEHAAWHGVTKAVVYMGGGAAVIASPISETAKLVRDGETGMLAAGRAEWTAKLDQLVRDAALRQRVADAGLRQVRGSHSLPSCFARFREALAV
jgi:glycosyltransferase involved in cell wall biosynthesis